MDVLHIILKLYLDKYFSGLWKVQSGFSIIWGHVHDFGMKRLSLGEGGQFLRAKYSIGYKPQRIPAK